MLRGCGSPTAVIALLPFCGLSGPTDFGRTGKLTTAEPRFNGPSGSNFGAEVLGVRDSRTRLTTGENAIFRVVMLVCGTVFLALGLLFVSAGESGQGLPFALVGAGFLVPDVWPRRFATAYPVQEWLGMGLAGAG